MLMLNLYLSLVYAFWTCLVFCGFQQFILLKSAKICKIFEKVVKVDKELVFLVKSIFWNGWNQSRLTSQYFILVVKPHEINAKGYFHFIMFTGINRKRRNTLKKLLINITWGLGRFTISCEVTLIWGTYRNF